MHLMGFNLASKKISKCFINPSFLCGFCAAAEVVELQSKHSKIVEQSPIKGELSNLINADSNQLYQRGDNVR